MCFSMTEDLHGYHRIAVKHLSEGLQLGVNPKGRNVIMETCIIPVLSRGWKVAKPCFENAPLELTCTKVDKIEPKKLT